ncbi:MAG: FHA domain-containing protein [Myxococcales bacterium]|nr:FHA domain-containing protein [Myxococcales bacterium]
MPYYTIEIQSHNGHVETRSIALTRCLIGRDGAHVLVDDAGASRRHAELRFENLKLFVKDLRSTNGTRMFGRLISVQELLPGQSFQIGATTFVLVSIHAEDWVGEQDKTIMTEALADWIDEDNEPVKK